jgi:crotonobetainyl-CoA:carnitine CoA-transferase CaiB-like acyl-CoA transferase
MRGLRVVEYADERACYAGKLLADMGADVIKVEPPAGDPTRSYQPFLGDTPDPERSLYFLHYNANKQGIVLDLETAAGCDAFRRLVATADFLIETASPGYMAERNIDYADLAPHNPGLIHIAVTPFGRDMPRAGEHATDLTIFSNGGVTWMNGYDDHSLPPVRGGGNQACHTGAHFAVMSGLVALLHRDNTGRGQFIDVNMNAAANVTTEAGSYTWLVSQETVQRQTGRHAAVNPSMPSQVQCADGRWVNTGVPPRRPHEFRRIHDWLTSAGFLDDFAEAPILLVGAAREHIDLSRLNEDEEIQAIFGAGRAAMSFIASRLNAYDFFTGAQDRGFQVGIIYSPEEVIQDPHFLARDWPTELEHPELGRTFTYPGAPYRFEKSPWELRTRAPFLGEHTTAVLKAIGMSRAEITEASGGIVTA